MLGKKKSNSQKWNGKHSGMGGCEAPTSRKNTSPCIKGGII